MGIAKHRTTARQLVLHKHITVNGNVVNTPSFHVRPGDVIAVREKSKSLEIIVEAISSRKKFNWIEFDEKQMSGVFVSYPERDQIPEKIKEQLIVELYSK